MVKLILSIYAFFERRRKTLFGILLAMVVVLVFIASRINFKEDISAFLPKKNDAGRISDALQLFSSTNKLIVNVGMDEAEPDLIIEAVTHFVELLQQSDSTGIYFKKMDYKVEPQQILDVMQFVTENMPYFLTENDYKRMDTLLTEDYIGRKLSENRRTLMSPAGFVMKRNIMIDPLHLSESVLTGLSDFQFTEQFQLYNDFIFSEDRTEGLVIIESQHPVSESRKNAEMLKLIDIAAENTRNIFGKEISIHYYGSVDIAVTNANRIKNDAVLSSVIAIILIFSLLIYAFRDAKNLILMLGSLVFGWLLALALLSVIRDEVSIIAIGISSIIIGIAANYPLHFILHNKHEPRIFNVIKDIATPLTIGNFTTVGAFLSLTFMSSEAMRDLGLFASFLLIGTICFVLFFLPHFLKKNNHENIHHELTFGKLLAWTPKSNKWLPWIFVLLSVIFCILSFNTKFETDMQGINYMTERQKENYDKYLSTIEEGQKIYYISQGENLDEALAVYESSKAVLDSMQSVGLLSKIVGLGVYLPSKIAQQQRIERWKTFCESKRDLFSKIEDIGAENGFKPDAFTLFNNILTTSYEVRDIDFFEPIISTLAENYMVNDENGSMIMTVLHTAGENPEVLEAKLNTVNSKAFSFDAQTFSRNMVSVLSTDFNTVLFICGFIVFVFLVITLGRIELSVIAFLPLTIGWFWILGIMNICDIRFNIVNIILAAFIFGQGDDYTIFVTEGLMYEYAYKRKVLVSYKNSIIISALIMFIGIGTLILAKHPALRSLAEITVIGMGSVVLMTFVLPPIIFRWLTEQKGERRLMPITISNIAASIYSFTAFLVGMIIATVAGFFFFTAGKATDKKKFLFHRLICWFARFVVVRIPRVKTSYNDFDKTVFDKPSIIICNHQSHIDLMCVISLTPKLIILTNDWVWNSPFYGHIIKHADFYPVSAGAENAIEKLQDIVEKGYSIVVFPEGTRSEDCTIQRFHRGAFYLAERLKLDILPIIIHGVGHLLPKKEFMLRRGEIHINVMQRVNLTGETYAERAKIMRKFYIDEYAKLADNIETADYYADLVQHNYIYKGPSVERTVRNNLKKHGNYAEQADKLSGKNRILILNCGYGELPLLLSIVHKNTEITATDNDPDKLDLAANCGSVPSNLHYVPSVNEDEFDTFDSIVLVKTTEECIEIVK